jgi:hypothetical protein
MTRVDFGVVLIAALKRCATQMLCAALKRRSFTVVLAAVVIPSV